MADKKAPVRRKKDRRKSSRRGQSSKVELDELFVDGEEVVLEGEIHNAIYWKAVALFIVAVLIGVFIVLELGIFLAGVALLSYIYAMLKKNILQLVLTNKRVFVRYGLLQVDVVDIQFSKIESIELERMLPGFIFGYSNVVIMGTGNRYIVIPYVGNALQFRRTFNKIDLEDKPEQGQSDQGDAVRGRRHSDEDVLDAAGGRRATDRGEAPFRGRRDSDQ